MSDRSQPPAEDETDAGAEQAPPPEMPRWVKVTGIVVGALILLGVVILMVGGEHGPGRHAPGGAAPDHDVDTPPIEGGPQLEVTAADMAFDPDAIELPAGMPLNVVLTNPDGTFHDLVVDEIDFHLGADPGETAVGGMVFDEPGSYVAYCSVPGHRDAGMVFQVEVVASDDGGHRPPPGMH